MALSGSLTEYAKYIEQLLNDNKATLGLADVWYGDQERIPRNPAVCIETGEKINELNGAPRRVKVVAEVFLLVYHNALMAGAAGQREENDRLAEKIEELIHTKEDFDGLVVHTLVTSVEAGYSSKPDAIWQVSRITVEITSQVMLPYSA